MNTNWLKNITLLILNIQEGFLKFRLNRTLCAKHNAKRKKYYSNGCLIDFNAIAECDKQKLEEEIALILKNYNFEPVRILEYIQKQGTTVIFDNKCNKLLNILNENEGFILPLKGLKALLISLLITKEFKWQTNEMFLLSGKNINKYYFMYHFYNWFAFKHNIEGIDIESQNLLKKYLFDDSNLNELQLADIYKLKDAIKQDKNAIEFVIKICKNYEGSQKALEKIKENGSANL